MAKIWILKTQQTENHLCNSSSLIALKSGDLKQQTYEIQQEIWGERMALDLGEKKYIAPKDILGALGTLVLM